MGLIFRLTETKTEPREESAGGSKGRGRVIDMSRPVLSLLLEPRSLVITTQELYTDHLHGIDPLAEDILLPAHSASDSSKPDATPQQPRGGQQQTGVRVANWDMIKDPMMREVAMNGGTLRRDVRVSLTCRDVVSVVSVKSLR